MYPDIRKQIRTLGSSNQLKKHSFKQIIQPGMDFRFLITAVGVLYILFVYHASTYIGTRRSNDYARRYLGLNMPRNSIDKSRATCPAREGLLWNCSGTDSSEVCVGPRNKQLEEIVTPSFWWNVLRNTVRKKIGLRTNGEFYESRQNLKRGVCPTELKGGGSIIVSHVEACSDYVRGSCRRPPTRTAAVKIVHIFVEDEGSSESPSLSFCGDMGIRTSSNNISTPMKHRQTHARSPDEERRKQPTARPAREELPLMWSPRTAVASSK